MLKTLIALALGAAILVASAVWSGSVIERKLVQLETSSGPDMGPGPDRGPIRLVP